MPVKPLSLESLEGRTLLALRAGPMNVGEINARIKSSLPGSLIKAGYVVLTGDYYRITAAGRAACPYRNPLAAPGAVQPCMINKEIDMPRKIVAPQKTSESLEKSASAVAEMLSHFHPGERKPNAIQEEDIENIEIAACLDRCSPRTIELDYEDDFDITICSDRTMTIIIDDGLSDAVIKFSPAALYKLREFLGLFGENA